MELGIADTLAPKSLKRQRPYWRERFRHLDIAIEQLQLGASSASATILAKCQ